MRFRFNSVQVMQVPCSFSCTQNGEHDERGGTGVECGCECRVQVEQVAGVDDLGRVPATFGSPARSILVPIVMVYPP